MASQNVRELREISRQSGSRERDLAVFRSVNRLAAPTRARAKKNPNDGFGFNPPKEEVEETEANYMSPPCATQEHLHCEMQFHNVANSLIAP